MSFFLYVTRKIINTQHSFLSMCVCVHMCAGMHVHVGTYLWVPENKSRVIPQELHVFVLETRSLFGMEIQN